MARFKDNKGDEWSITFTVGDLERLVRDAEFDLTKLAASAKTTQDAVTETIALSPSGLVRVAWVLCEDDAKLRGIEPSTFGRRFDRAALDRFQEALLEEVVLFSHRSSAGNAIREKLPEVWRKMDQEIQAAASKEMDRVASSGTATGSPESSVSIPEG